jgi:hypothetical protein
VACWLPLSSKFSGTASDYQSIGLYAVFLICTIEAMLAELFIIAFKGCSAGTVACEAMRVSRCCRGGTARVYVTPQSRERKRLSKHTATSAVSAICEAAAAAAAASRRLPPPPAHSISCLYALLLMRHASPHAANASPHATRISSLNPATGTATAELALFYPDGPANVFVKLVNLLFVVGVCCTYPIQVRICV